MTAIKRKDVAALNAEPVEAPVDVQPVRGPRMSEGERLDRIEQERQKNAKE